VHHYTERGKDKESLFYVDQEEQCTPVENNLSESLRKYQEAVAFTKQQLNQEFQRMGSNYEEEEEADAPLSFADPTTLYQKA
jgi:hypothetical protein